MIVAPSTLYEALRVKSPEDRAARAKLITDPGWKRLMPEAYSESQELLAEVRRCHPEWLAKKGDRHYIHDRQFTQILRHDWRRTKRGFWNRVRQNPDLEAKRIAELGGERLVQGEAMTPSHAVKKGTRYRYYVSKSLLTGSGDKATKRGQRIPAAHIEALVAERIRAWLADPVAVLNAIQCCCPDAIAQKRLLDEAARLAAGWQDLDAEYLRALLLAIVTKVQVHSDRIDVTLDQMGVARWLNAKADKQQPVSGGCDREQHLTVLTIRARLKRTGIEMRMVVDDGSEPANVDPVLVRLLVRVHAIRGRLRQDPSLTLKEIAAEEGVGGPYVSRLVRLAFLAPDIVTAILNGRHPPQLTANRLMDDTRLPLDWRAQRELLCT